MITTIGDDIKWYATELAWLALSLLLALFIVLPAVIKYRLRRKHGSALDNNVER